MEAGKTTSGQLHRFELEAWHVLKKGLLMDRLRHTQFPIIIRNGRHSAVTRFDHFCGTKKTIELKLGQAVAGSHAKNDGFSARTTPVKRKHAVQRQP